MQGHSRGSAGPVRGLPAPSSPGWAPSSFACFQRLPTCKRAAPNTPPSRRPRDRARRACPVLGSTGSGISTSTYPGHVGPPLPGRERAPSTPWAPTCRRCATVPHVRPRDAARPHVPGRAVCKNSPMRAGRSGVAPRLASVAGAAPVAVLWRPAPHSEPVRPPRRPPPAPDAVAAQAADRGAPCGGVVQEARRRGSALHRARPRRISPFWCGARRRASWRGGR